MSTLLNDAAQKLQIQGGRMTEQRRLILETLESLESHPSAEELHSIVQEQYPDIHLSTVYRTLRWLEQEGLVSSRWFEGDRRQERFDPALPIEHHHFLCNQCNKVIEFDHHLVDAIVQQFEVDFNAQIEATTLVLYGTCVDCRRRSRANW
jgi:Fur family ferric uptake transcriptional regulator